MTYSIEIVCPGTPQQWFTIQFDDERTGHWHGTIASPNWSRWTPKDIALAFSHDPSIYQEAMELAGPLIDELKERGLITH